MPQKPTSDWRDVLASLSPAEEPQQPDAPATGPAPAPHAKKPALTLHYERKGRGGKQATIIAGFPDTMPDDAIAALASTIKQRLGTGGSARGGEILIQGDRRADLAPLLRSLGYPCK